MRDRWAQHSFQSSRLTLSSCAVRLRLRLLQRSGVPGSDGREARSSLVLAAPWQGPACAGVLQAAPHHWEGLCLCVPVCVAGGLVVSKGRIGCMVEWG